MEKTGLEGTTIKLVKEGKELLTINREAVSEIKETHDGISINLKAMPYIYIMDVYMPQEVKIKIVNSDKFKKANLVIDLSNLSIPVRVLPI